MTIAKPSVMPRTSSPPFVKLAACLLVVGCSSPTSQLRHDVDHDEGAVSLPGTELRESFTLVDGYRVSEMSRSDGPTNRVGVWLQLLPGSEDINVEIEVATVETPESWSGLETIWSEGPYRVLRHNLPAEEMVIRWRLPEALTSHVEVLSFHHVHLEPEDFWDEEDDLMSHASALSSELAGHGVIPRSAWGARPSTCRGDYIKKREITIHHTASGTVGDPAELLRSVQHLHMRVQGYCDIGYHILVSPDGRLWEGTPMERRGVHVAMKNSGNIGVSLMGCFEASGCSGSRPHDLTPAMMRATGQLLCNLRQMHDMGPANSVVRGHREHLSTACPGSVVMARMNELQEAAACNPAPMCEDRWGSCPGSGREFDEYCCGDLICEAGTCVRHRITPPEVPARTGPTHYSRIGARCSRDPGPEEPRCAESLQCKPVLSPDAVPTCCAPLDRRCNYDADCCGATACEEGRCRARTSGQRCVLPSDCEGGLMCRNGDLRPCSGSGQDCVCGGSAVRG